MMVDFVCSQTRATYESTDMRGLTPWEYDTFFLSLKSTNMDGGYFIVLAKFMKKSWTSSKPCLIEIVYISSIHF